MVRLSMLRPSRPPLSIPPSVEDVLSHQREVIAELIRSPSLSQGDVESALRELTEAASRLIDVQRASVWLFNADRTRIECLDLYDAATEEHAGGLALERQDAPAYFGAAVQERCIVAHDARNDPRTREFSESYLVAHGITSMLDAPVLVRGELVGVVCHEHVGPPREWHAREELLAGTLADLAGMALSAGEHAAQARELRALHDNLEQLVEHRTAELRQARDNVRALYEALPVAMILTRADDGSVLLTNPQACELFGVAPDSARGKHLPDFWADQTPRAELLAKLERVSLVEGFECELKKRDGQSFWASVSARTLTFDGAPCVLFTVQDISHKREMEEQLRLLATTDDLTGIYNRRHFFELAERLLRLAERHGRALSAVMLDVDRFKAINDRYGHQVGDSALVMLTQICRQELRQSDVLGRYGGEEFVVLLPETGAGEARQAVERIRERLAATPLRTGDGAIHFTISGGVAERLPGESLEDLLKRADAALYDAKASGRDCVK